MKKQDLLWVMIVLGLTVIGVLNQAQIQDFLSAMQSSLLPARVAFEEFTSDLESIDISGISLPEIVGDEISGDTTPGISLDEEGQIPGETTPGISLGAEGLNSSMPGVKEKKMSLAEIQEQVDIISVKTMIISLEVTKLALAEMPEQQTPESAQQIELTSIQEQITQILEQIQLLSQQVQVI